MTRLPDRSTLAVHAPYKEALVARSPAPRGPATPVPAGVVSRSLPGFTFLTAKPVPMYTLPPANDTPQGDIPIRVARAGPPTPPATVEITPPAPGRGPPGTAAAPGCPPAAPGPPPAGVAPPPASPATSAGPPRRNPLI